MKIGLVCPYSIAKGGGVQEIVYAMQRELNRRGHDAYIITPRPQDHEGEPEDHVIFVGASVDFSSPLRTTGQVSASVSETIERMLEEEQFDILHFHEPWVPMLSLQILSRSNAVNVATFHAKLPETMMVRTVAKVVTPYTKSVLKYIDAYTAPSDAAAEYVCSLTDEPVAIIPNGIDLTRFKPPKIFNDTRQHKTIVYIGRLEARKGVNYLLHAFKQLQEDRPDVSLVIAGDGTDRSKLEMLAEDLELQNVKFLGYLPEADKPKLLQSADLFCAPALYGESFGIVLLEAMAAAKGPVLAGDNPGYASVLGKRPQQLFDPKDTQVFAGKIVAALKDDDARAEARAWQQDYVQQFDISAVGPRLVAVYEQALQRHPR